ncbi:MAG: hypothetical protein A3G75_04440 [Verrucomicrobia bacterium RIFCSPLOWO2_12_FULL_64_8]|nr:MAG: hypothetical protein A3G75_04440 [Verrucomicrobia bacterium RIFCSPLOWO2_12_FULL_64_8]
MPRPPLHDPGVNPADPLIWLLIDPIIKSCGQTVFTRKSRARRLLFTRCNQSAVVAFFGDLPSSPEIEDREPDEKKAFEATGASRAHTAPPH